MKKILSLSGIGLIFFISIFAFQVSSCKKDDDPVITPIPTPTPIPVICDIKGIYSGTSVPSTGASSSLTYSLKENNYAVGSVTPTGSGVTFGGYKNTCDSVYISVYYNGNSSSYLLSGKLTNNKATISGTFKNLNNTSDYGTFSISK